MAGGILDNGQLKRRTLEGDSRDCYGFTVRPQHLQTYREYGHIYKEEEEERLGKWKDFLQQVGWSPESCGASETEATDQKAESILDSCQKEDDSRTSQPASAGSKEAGAEKVVPVGKEKARKVQTWAPISQSLVSIENMMSVRIKRIVSFKVDQQPSSQRHSHPINEKRSKRVSFKVEPKLLNASKHSEVVDEIIKNEDADDSHCRKDMSNISCPDVEHDSFTKQEKTDDYFHKKDIPPYQECEEELYKNDRDGDGSFLRDASCQKKVKQGESCQEAEEESFNNEKKADGICHNGLSCQKVGKPGEHDKRNIKNDYYSEREIVVDDKCTTDKRNAKSNVVPSEPLFSWKEELESLVRGGVPKSLRGEVWQAFVGVHSRRVDMYYQNLILSEFNSGEKEGTTEATKGMTVVGHAVSEKLKRQIEKDLPRTFPGHPALDEEGRDSLRRILTAYARHNPSVGYCQAMNFFAGLLLLLMPEENAFWTLVGLIDEYFDGYYTQEMIESQVDQLVFEELMRERFPRLINHLDYLGVQVTWLSGPWFISIFANMLPWESVLRVWDVLLFEGNRVMLFRTALALMELYGPALVTTKDAGDAVILLQSLAGSTFDSSQLVLTACMGFPTVTEPKLEELRNKHRPAVLGIIEERSKGTEVSKESKGLATKLQSFKHGPQGVMKEANKTQRKNSRLIGGDIALKKCSADHFDKLLHEGNIDPEVDSVPELREQVIWLKGELCNLLEEKRLANLRAEELETALMEMVKHDNRRQLSARAEHLELEVSQLRQIVSDKEEQEKAMLEVLVRMEQEQKVAEDARRAAELEAESLRNAARVFQEKYEKAIASLTDMEKRVKMAESMLEATLQYQSGQAKALCSPRTTQQESPNGLLARRTGILPFGLGWRDKNKGKSSNADEGSEGGSVGRLFRRQTSSLKSDENKPSPKEQGEW